MTNPSLSGRGSALTGGAAPLPHRKPDRVTQD